MAKIGSSKSHLNALSRRFDRISDKTADENIDKIFERVSRKIVAEFSSRSTRGVFPDSVRPIPWLESVCYEFVSEIIYVNQTDVFERRIEKYGRGKRGPKGNLFQVAILAIFADETLTKLTSQTRERIGKRLWCAYRHYVPGCFLSGFLLQVCDRGFSKRVAQNAIEPDFEKWVVDQRVCLRDRHLARGAYPAAIEKAVRKKQNKPRTFYG